MDIKFIILMWEIDIYCLKQLRIVIHKSYYQSIKKNPQPRMLMLTLKRVREMFPHMEDIEYKVSGIGEN